MSEPLHIGCILLAAGESRRFGQKNKLTVPLYGMPIFQRTLRAVPRERFAELSVVTRWPEIAEICRRENVRCVLYDGGTISDSIRQGIDAMPAQLDGYLLINGDRPLLTRETICRMLTAFHEHPDAVIRLYRDGHPSNPVLFPGSARNALLNLTGEQGGSVLLKTGSYRIIPVEATSPEEILDIDTPDMLARAERIIKCLNNQNT